MVGFYVFIGTQVLREFEKGSEQLICGGMQEVPGSNPG